MHTLRQRRKKLYGLSGGIAVNALGYNNPIIKRAVKKQLDKVILVSNYFYSEPRASRGAACKGNAL